MDERFNASVSADGFNLHDKRVDLGCWLKSGFKSPWRQLVSSDDNMSLIWGANDILSFSIFFQSYSLLYKPLGVTVMTYYLFWNVLMLLVFPLFF